MSKPIQPGQPPQQIDSTRKVGPESEIATQVGSNGPILPESFFSSHSSSFSSRADCGVM